MHAAFCPFWAAILCLPTERSYPRNATALRRSGGQLACRRAGRLARRSGRPPGHHARCLNCWSGRQDAALCGRQDARRYVPVAFAIDVGGLKAYSGTMALINCPECGKQASSAAPACPACGYPIAEKLGPSQDTPPAGGLPPAAQTQMLAEIRPSWWGYFWHLFFFWLIIPPIIAYFRRASTVLRIYPQRVMVERGLLSSVTRNLTRGTFGRLTLTKVSSSAWWALAI